MGNCKSCNCGEMQEIVTISKADVCLGDQAMNPFERCHWQEGATWIFTHLPRTKGTTLWLLCKFGKGSITVLLNMVLMLCLISLLAVLLLHAAGLLGKPMLRLQLEPGRLWGAHVLGLVVCPSCLFQMAEV